MTTQGCPGFDVLVYGKSADTSAAKWAAQKPTFDVKYNRVVDIADVRFGKDALSSHSFTKAIKSLELAISKGDHASVDRIINDRCHSQQGRQVLRTVRDNAQQKVETLAAAKASSSQASSSSSSSSSSAQSSAQTIQNETYQVDSSGIILGNTSIENLSNELATDMVMTDRELYAMNEYIRQTDEIIANTKDQPLREALIAARDYAVLQWADLGSEYSKLADQAGNIWNETKEQCSLVTTEAICRAFEQGIKKSFSNPIDNIREEVNNLAWRVGKVGELAEGLMHVLAVHGETLMPPVDQQKFCDLMQQGKTEEAFGMLVQTNSKFEMIRDKIVHNLSHPVEFVGQNARGIVDVVDKIKNIALEPTLDALRSDEQRQQVFEQRMQTFNEIVDHLKNATPEQVNQITTDIVADGVSLKVMHTAYVAAKNCSSTPASSSASTDAGSSASPLAEQQAVTPAEVAAKIEIEAHKAPSQATLTSDGQLVHTKPEVTPLSTAESSAQSAGKFVAATEEAAGRTGQVSLERGKVIVNDVIDSKRIGSALKKDVHHAFNDIIDNYASYAKEFQLQGNDFKIKKLFQIEGSLDGAAGIFEWIVDPNTQSVTHRLFIKNGHITGKPNIRKS